MRAAGESSHPGDHSPSHLYRSLAGSLPARFPRHSKWTAALKASLIKLYTIREIDYMASPKFASYELRVASHGLRVEISFW